MLRSREVPSRCECPRKCKLGGCVLQPTSLHRPATPHKHTGCERTHACGLQCGCESPAGCSEHKLQYQMPRRAPHATPYQTLEVAEDATDEDIKRSYRRLALKLHPDKQVGLSEEEQQDAEKLQGGE